jgi:SAM-dependent methyltransferase
VFPTGSFDAVYTNALDHVFDLPLILAEVRRVLKPGGLFIVDLAYGSEEGGLAGEFEALSWRDGEAMIDRLAALGAFNLVEARELRKVRQARWRQAVLRKSASDTGGELVILDQGRKLEGGTGPEGRAARASVLGGHGRKSANGGRPMPRRASRHRAAAVFASCLLAAATVGGFFLLRGVVPRTDQPQQTWVTPPT